jgi:hypothetical protein
MADHTSGTDDDTARMTLDADAFHEAEELSIDCPNCGATVGVMEIAETGHCDGIVGADEIEGDSEVPTEGNCDASLSLELVWAA